MQVMEAVLTFPRLISLATLSTWIHPFLMAETVATATGIAGIISVLRSLLQCYNDFLTARDFEEDLAICQLRVALLENSTVTWAIAVGLRHESGEPRDELLVEQPTEKRAFLVQATLNLIHTQLQSAILQLDTYTTIEPVPEDGDGALESPSAGAIAENAYSDKSAMLKRFAAKVHRSIHRQHSAEHPGTLKRTTWALVDKARLEATLDKVTTLVDRLNTDFAPVDQKSQLDLYCEVVKEAKLSEEELKNIGETAGDCVFKTVVTLLNQERATGNRFMGIEVSADGTLNIGDYYDKGWNGGAPRQGSRNDVFQNLRVKDRAYVNIGDQFGGKSPMQVRLEQMEAARQARGTGSRGI